MKHYHKDHQFFSKITFSKSTICVGKTRLIRNKMEWRKQLTQEITKYVCILFIILDSIYLHTNYLYFHFVIYL